MKRKILFLSYNRHQYILFSFICANMKQEATFLLTSLTSFLKGIFLKSGSPPLAPAVVDELIKFSYLSYSARRPQGRVALFSRWYHKYLGFKARTLHKYYDHYLQKEAIDLLVVWNGHHLEAAGGVKAARNLGIKVTFMENGFFPQTLVLDEQGVNAANSLAGKPADYYREVEVDPVRLAQFKATELLPRELRKNFTGTEEIEYPSKFFFLPFQVHTDTQVLLNSPYIHNMYDLVDTVYYALEQFNQENQEDYWLVVKEHPSDFGRIDYSDLKKKYQNAKVIFITTEPSGKLIGLSQAVITINSTVGLEALLKGKPVITLGEAFYNVEGVVAHCTDPSQLPAIMAQVLSEPVNTELVERFLYFLRYEYLVEVERKNLTVENITPVVKRIRKIMDQ